MPHHTSRGEETPQPTLWGNRRGYGGNWGLDRTGKGLLHFSAAFQSGPYRKPKGRVGPLGRPRSKAIGGNRRGWLSGEKPLGHFQTTKCNWEKNLRGLTRRPPATRRETHNRGDQSLFPVSKRYHRGPMGGREYPREALSTQLDSYRNRGEGFLQEPRGGIPWGELVGWRVQPPSDILTRPIESLRGHKESFRVLRNR